MRPRALAAILLLAVRRRVAKRNERDPDSAFLRLREARCRVLHGLGDHQRLILGYREVMGAFMSGERQHHKVWLLFWPTGLECRDEISGRRSVRHSLKLFIWPGD
jgi:hypothetical protein